MSVAQSVVIVSRQWHEPAIGIHVTDRELGVSIALEDFLEILVEEVGSPAMVFTAAQLQAKLRAAAVRVTEGMKAEILRVPQLLPDPATLGTR